MDEDTSFIWVLWQSDLQMKKKWFFFDWQTMHKYGNYHTRMQCKLVLQ